MSLCGDLHAVLWAPVLHSGTTFGGTCWGGKSKDNERGKVTQENAEVILRVLLSLDTHCDFVLIEVRYL